MFGIFLFASSASALRLAPTLIDINVKPGEGIVKKIKLTNETVQAVTVVPVVYDASAGMNEEGFPQIADKTAESTLANWIEMNDAQSITLQAGQSKDVSVMIKVPANAPPGGHYAVVAWSTISSGVAPDQTGAALVGQVAGNIAVNVAGNTISKGDIISFSTEGNITKYEKLPVSFTSRISNSGNRHFKPQGTITINDMFGRSVETLQVNNVNAGGNVLPQSIREFKASWDNGFAFGKYNAILSLSLGQAGNATANYEFWVLPTGLLVLWLIIAIVVIIILAMLIKNMMSSVKKS
jgi:hypothetical protein